MASDKPVSHEEAEKALSALSFDWGGWAAESLDRYIREQREREAELERLREEVNACNISGCEKQYATIRELRAEVAELRRRVDVAAEGDSRDLCKCGHDRADHEFGEGYCRVLLSHECACAVFTEPEVP